MHDRAHVLVVENSQKTLAAALEPALGRHDVEIAADGIEAIRRTGCGARAYDVIFCDLASDGFSGRELWAYWALRRPLAACGIVFVASGSLLAQTRAFLDRIPNPCIALPVEAEALEALISRRASRRVEAAA